MALTDVKIRNTKPGEKTVKLTDSGGLLLEVRPNGSKLWRYRYRIAGKENLYAIGDYPTVSLQEARVARDEARLLVKSGVHPSHARQAQVNKQLDSNRDTFQHLATAWIESRCSNWTPYYLKQINSYFNRDVFPKIGRRPLRSLTTVDFREVIDTIAKRGAKAAATNVRTWCSAVCCYAITKGKADADPVAPLRRLVSKDKDVEHAEPMSLANLAIFRDNVETYGGLRTTALTLKLMLYCFVRTVEFRRGRWDQIRWDEGMWVIEAELMKKRKTHIIPLSRQAREALEELRTITGSGTYLVPNSRRPSEMMGPTTVNRALEYLGVPHTGHDFRATASTYLYERGWSEEVVEMQLAHAERNTSKKAYNHAKYLEQRRVMMQEWADWVDSLPSPQDQPRRPRSRLGSSQRHSPSSSDVENAPS